MLDLGWTEILMIGVIAVVIIGPKDLPKAMHGLAQWMRKLRGMARDFQGQVDDMVKGTELEEVRKAAQGLNRYNVKRQISNVVDPKGQMKKALEETRRAANERLDVKDTSSAGMATPPDAGDAVAAASIGGGVGAPKRPAIEEAEPTPADDEAAVAAMRGDLAPEAVAEPEAPAEPAPKRKPAKRSAAASGTTAKKPRSGKAAAAKSSTAKSSTAKSSTAKARKKPATVAAKPDAEGAAPAKAKGGKPSRAAKGANGATSPAQEQALAADDVADGDSAAPNSGAASKPASGTRRTRKAAPARRRKPAVDAAPSGAAARGE